ncbi:MAG TPA: hypothetical protein VJR27_01620 [Candidatus Saccharimonadales bacterium]|nr:hypothetical protein [Candidatus Saccharimonadales bacterium]
MESGNGFSFQEEGDAFGREPMAQVNQTFAEIVREEESLTESGEPRIIARPDGFTETSFATPDNGQVTLYSSAQMDPAARAAAKAAWYAEVRERFGRTEAVHDKLLLALDTAKAAYETAYATDEIARRQEPGSANQLAALLQLEGTKDAYRAAMQAFFLNNFEPIIKQTPSGVQVNGRLLETGLDKGI